MRDPTVNPGKGNPSLNKQESRYIKNVPDSQPAGPFATKGLKIDAILPRDPDVWKNNFMTVYPSASHTYGNVLSSIEQFIIDLFPPGLFKSVNTSTSASNIQLRSTPAQLIKKRFPLMVSKARIDYGQDDNRALGYTLLADRIADHQMTWGLGNLQPFMNDRVHNFKLDWFLNRWVMNIDFILAFNTKNEQINWLTYFENSVAIGHPFLITRPLETMLPRPLIDEISWVTGIPVYDNGSVGPFLQYLQSISQDPITYKMKSGSGNDEFFRYRMTPIDCTITPPDADEGIRSSQTQRLFEITFTVRTEFNGIGYFFMTSPNIRYKSDKPIFPSEDDKTVVCHYTDDINYRLLDIPPGWCVLATPSFQFGSYDDNTIDFKPILDDRLNRMIQVFIDNRMDPSLFLSFQFRYRSNVIKLNTPWRIDWKNRRIIMEEVDLHETYRMLVLVNNHLINNYTKKAMGVK